MTGLFFYLHIVVYKGFPTIKEKDNMLINRSTFHAVEQFLLNFGIGSFQNFLFLR